MADETDIERACRVIDRSIERHEKDAETIRDLTAALQRGETFLAFDLRKMVEWGPDFNQAAKDTLDRIRAALKLARESGNVG